MNYNQRLQYVNERVNNKLFSKIKFIENELRHYFQARHIGLAGGIDKDMTKALVMGTIRELRVWKEIDLLTHTVLHIDRETLRTKYS